MATYYINADIGNNATGDGSSGNPWKTFSHAHNNIVDGDTIVPLPSIAEYEFESLTNLTKGFNLIGANDDSSNTVFSTPLGTAHWVFNANGITVNIQKIEFKGIRTFDDYSGGVGVPLFQLNQPMNFTIDQCIIRDIDMTSSFSVGGIVSPISGLAASGSFIRVSSCILYNVRDFRGVPPSGFAQSAMFCIRNATDCTYEVIDNSILIESGHQLGRVYSIRPSSCTLIEKGNLIKNAGEALEYADFAGGLTSASSENNHFNIGNLPSLVTNDSTNLTDDPFWVDETNRNFNLAPGSTAIDSRSIE